MKDTPKQLQLTIGEVLTHFELNDRNFSFYTGQKGAVSKNGGGTKVITPINGGQLAEVEFINQTDFEEVLTTAEEAFKTWRAMPAPHRGEIIRQYGNVLRENKEMLAMLVTMECGKILQEGLGEVQEMIDICDFAVGLSRQLYGFTMQSERPGHRMYDQYHPLGVVGIISAFNFPVAVWAWNASLAAIAGNVCIWKPSEKTPLTALACHKLLIQVLQANNVPEGVFNLVIGDGAVGQMMSESEKVALVSATGSTAMGKKVATTVAKRLGKTLLELGGNNAVILTPSTDLQMAIRSTVFGAAGTCGQRCTTTRRLIVHADIYDKVKESLLKAYQKLPIGNPLENGVLVGPLIDLQAQEHYLAAIEAVRKEGGKVLCGAGTLNVSEDLKGGAYVLPTIIEAENHYSIVQKETFAPILYLIKYEGEIDNAIAIQNDVKQGLSSSIFTLNMREAELFLSNKGSDCGIANVNIGTSGAEIGGAFGGEKETGGGRESGSDAWKAYMRRQTNTINYSTALPLAQGIVFDIEV